MPDVKKLAGLMRDLEEQLVVCMRCGMCQSVCPLYAETGREADVARGKLALLNGLLQEMFKDPSGVKDRLDKCLLCGSCAAGCPSGVSVLEIFIKARAILTGYMGLSLAKKAVLRGMLVHPEIFDCLTEWASRLQKLFIKPANDLLGTSCARFASPIIAGRHFKPLTSKQFHQIAHRYHSQPGRSPIKVGFFIGCLIDKIFPHVAEAVMDVLQHHGVMVFIPDGQACCGIPALSAGDTTTFNNLLKHNLEIFDVQSFDYLVTACATCTSTLKKIWPIMAKDLPDSVEDRVNQLASRTLDINQFIVGQVGLETNEETKSRNTTPVTYHDPCHLKKSLGVYSEPRELIRANPDYNLHEMADPDWCCGLGGSFNIQYYGISSEIGSRKRDQVQATGCAAVATGCPACMLQLSDMLSQSNIDVSVIHPVEIYAKSLVRRS